MKYALSAMALAGLMAVGCQNSKKSTTSESVMDPTPPPTAPATPVVYTAPEPVVTPAPPPANTMVAASGSSYTVKPGDTLWKIAANHYGDGKKWKQIADANPGVTPQKLKVGQTITLP